MDLPMESTNLSCYVKNDPQVELVEPPAKMYECEKLPFAAEAYPELDLKFFEITQKHKGLCLPLFGIYPIDAPSKCVVAFERDEQIEFAWRTVHEGFYRQVMGLPEEGSPKPKPKSKFQGRVIPKSKFQGRVIVEGYPDQISEIVRAQLQKELKLKMFKGHKKNERLVFTSNFHGIIPKDTKEKIESARPVLGNISIVAEAHDWQCTKEVITRDPLVIGCVGDRWFLIDHFDTTGAEDYIISKFSEAIAGAVENNKICDGFLTNKGKVYRVEYVADKKELVTRALSEFEVRK